MSGLEFTNGDVKPDKHDENVAATRPTGRVGVVSDLLWIKDNSSLV